MILTSLWHPWKQFRGHQVLSEHICAITDRKGTNCHKCIRTHQIWSMPARGWPWQASGNPGGSLRGIKSLKSISVPSLKKRHRLPKIAKDCHRWAGMNRKWSNISLKYSLNARKWLVARMLQATVEAEVISNSKNHYNQIMCEQFAGAQYVLTILLPTLIWHVQVISNAFQFLGRFESLTFLAFLTERLNIELILLYLLWCHEYSTFHYWPSGVIRIEPESP